MSHFKPYPAYKPSGVEWLGDVPEHWEVKRLKYAVRCLDGRRIPLNSEQRADIKGDIPYWGSGGVVDYINQYLFDEELILLGEDGAPFFDRFRPVAYFVSGKVWINNHIHVLRNISRTPSAWIVHALNCVEYRLYIDGSTRDKLTQDDMKEIALPFPSNAQEAKIILEILDRETGRIDALVEKKRRFIELLKEKRQALITAAVTGQIDVRTGKPYPAYKPSGVEWLGDVPEHWERLPIKYTALGATSLFLDGDWIESKDISGNEIRYITTGNVGIGRYKEQGLGYITETKFKELNRPVFIGGVFV